MTYTYIDEQDAEKQFNEMLDESYPIEMMGIHFDASRVLKEIDPTAYRCTFNDWLDAMRYTTELIPYRVELIEADAEEDEEGDKPSIYFECDAENQDHAEEQALDAYPDCEILDTEEA